MKFWPSPAARGDGKFKCFWWEGILVIISYFKALSRTITSYVVMDT